MTWQVFERQRGRGGPRPSTTPAAFLDAAHGALRLNRPARAKIGDPATVLLLFDPTDGRIGVRPCNEDDRRGYGIRPLSGSVSIRALMQHLDIDPPPGPRQVHFEDDTAFITITPEEQP